MGSDPRCGFCGCSPKEAFKLVRGLDPDCFICDACVYDSLGIIEDHKQRESKEKKGTKGSFTPKQIMGHLDQYVVGQEWAKKVLSVAVYNHFKRIGKQTQTEIAKSNILLIGPTGSGKTYLCETIAKFLKVPFAISDATSLTEAGYVGDDVESVLTRLVQAADGDIKKAENGIVYIDEIDKIACKDSRGRDVSGEGVQQGLLKMLEGAIVAINPHGRKTANAPQEMINTTNILFICGGAFSGITDFTQRKRSLGLSVQLEEGKIERLRHKDLIKFGMIPEFVGRFPMIAQLDPLGMEDLVKILTEPKNSLVKQYQELMALDGVKLSFTQDFLEEVAKRASTEGTGARGLRAIMEPALTEFMFQIPDESKDTLEVTPDILPK